MFNCLCSSSRFCASRIGILEPAVSRISDLVIIWKVSLLLHKFPIQSETGFGHFKEQFRLQASVVLRKKLFLIFCSAVQKLYKLSILLLLITNYLSVYLSIYLFVSFIYLFNYTLAPGAWYQKPLPKSTWLKATTNLWWPILSGNIFASLKVIKQITRAKHLCQYWWGSSRQHIHLLTLTVQNTENSSRCGGYSYISKIFSK